MKKLYTLIIQNNQYMLSCAYDNILNEKKNNSFIKDDKKNNLLKIYFDSKNYSLKKGEKLYHSVFFKISKYLINYSLVNFAYHNKNKIRKTDDIFLRFLKKYHFSYGNNKLSSIKIKNLSFKFKKKNIINASLSKKHMINFIDKITYHNKSTSFRYYFGIFFLSNEKNNKKIDFEKIMNYQTGYEMKYMTIQYDNLLSSFIKNYKNKKHENKTPLSTMTYKKTLYSFIKEPEINPSMFKIKTNWYCMV